MADFDDILSKGLKTELGVECGDAINSAQGCFIGSDKWNF